MALGTFNLFADIARPFVNLEKIRDIGRGLDVGSALGTLSQQVLGLASGTTLSNLLQLKLGGYGFIVDTVTGERLVFQYNVVGRETTGAEYNVQQVLGRSVPKLTYKGGKLRTLQLPITFTMNEFSRQDVRRNIRWLQALSYPDYDGQDEVSLAPHPVVVIQGQLYSQDLWLVQDCNVEMGASVDPVTLLPHEATANVSLIEVSERGKSRAEVIRL